MVVSGKFSFEVFLVCLYNWKRLHKKICFHWAPHNGGVQADPRPTLEETPESDRRLHDSGSNLLVSRPLYHVTRDEGLHSIGRCAFRLLLFKGYFCGPLISFLTLRDPPTLPSYPWLQEMTSSSHRRICTSAKLETVKGQKSKPSQECSERIKKPLLVFK